MTSTLAPEVNNDGRIYRLNQHMAAFVTSLGGFALGVTLGWNSSAGAILRNILNASGTEIGLIGGILNAGACVGVMFMPFFMKYFSRITAMSLTMPGFIIGWTFVCCAGQKISLLIIGRFICGMSGGAFCILTPIYIAEIADQNSRGRLLMYFQLLINCGIMYAFVAAHVLNEHDAISRYNFICAVTCLVVALVYLLPESPFYHLMKNNEIKAKNSLKWYRGQTYEDVEIEELKYLVSQSGKITINVLKNRCVISSFFTCFFAFLTQQLSGVTIMIFYALTLFNFGGSGDLTGSEQTVLIGGVQILSCFLAMGLVDIIGRRLLLIVSSILMGLFLILLGWFYKLRDQDPEYDDIYFWMPPTWTTLFFATFNLGVGPISWALIGDVFPMQIRETAIACAVAFNWLLSLIATMTFGEMLDALGVSKTMWLFASSCWIAGALCALLLKDTRGHSLAKIQKSFGIEDRQVEINGIEQTFDIERL
ncbi:facilitated trehalose transporter Tret1-like [Temnothorax curvispinosus]|uniref:Facilitated trehalose transporter Tret1-like n=1 Tax=Temnothorax curvispinosus TaxID=300111 RepID=A0A6J1RGY8_9HYME|nr:facilitated trehalose transporter Tret1-like [Temnothorax curvispinosus]